MSAQTGAADVAIIGGGVIGCALAWRLARRGYDVVLFDAGEPGRAASWAAGGMLSPLAEAVQPGPFLDLAVASLARYPEFVRALLDATGTSPDYRTAGKLQLALDDTQVETLRAQRRWQHAAGHRTEWLDAGAARALEPALTPVVRGALLLPDDHSIDPRLLTSGLRAAAVRSGARVYAHTRVISVLTTGDAPRHVTGVRLADGATQRAHHAIVAAGAWSGGIDGLPRALPIEPVRGQMLALRPERPRIDHVLLTERCYLIPRSDGRVIVGSTMERAGYQAETTDAALAALREAAIAAVPELARAGVAESWAGLRPATPDALPVIGTDPEVAGLVYATGHFRNGILLTPITVELVEALVAGMEPALSLAPFAPERFAAEVEHRCELCGQPMYDRHCKIACPNCGYLRDCSDP